MSDQPKLFIDTVAVKDAPRRRAIKAAFARADAAFLAKYEQFLRAFPSEEFIAGTITECFEQQHYKLSPSQKKALGYLFQDLQRRGVIAKTGNYRPRNQGSPAAEYRKV